MDNTALLLLALLGGGIGLLLIAAAVKYLVAFYSEIKYVKMEMRRAYDWDEYVYWRRELRALRWCIIPGMTVDRVKAIKRNIKSLFIRGKYEKKKEKNDGFISMLLPSVLGICLCAVCLVGGTFAWFTASNDVSTQTIVAADYSISHKVNGIEATVYDLTASKTYEITLTANGTAKTGYAILRYGKLDGEDAKYNEVHTQAVSVDDTVTIKVKPDADCQLQIIAQWGSSTQGENALKAWNETDDTVYPLNVPGTIIVSNGSTTQETEGNEEKDSTTETTVPDADTTETETTLNPTEYTVKSGDSLSKIADMYGTSVKRLAAYNGIEDPSKIYPGQVINIPPADWKIPETTTEETNPSVTEPSITETKPAETEPSESVGETTAATTETTVPQETTGTTQNSSESDSNE